MPNHPAHELPIRSKLQMLDDIVQIIYYLHTGQRKAAEELLEDLKTRALFLDESIQHNVLIFAEQVCFQYDYDRNHNVTVDVTRAADNLIKELGFSPK